MNGNNCLRQFLWFLRIWERRYLSEWLLSHLKSYQIVDLQCNYPTHHYYSLIHIEMYYILNILLYIKYHLRRALESGRNFEKGGSFE